MGGRAVVLVLGLCGLCACGDGTLWLGGEDGRSGRHGGGAVLLCGPALVGPRWVLEGEALTTQVGCDTGLGGPSLRFEPGPLPPGARWDAASATLTWTPARDQAAVWRIPVRELSTGETGELAVGVVEDEGAPGNVPIVDPARYTEEYGLPVAHLTFPSGLSADAYRTAQLVYRGHRYTLEAKYRGASSSVFPKRSYTLKFPDGDRFGEPVFGDGFTGRKHVALVTSFNDNSYVRPRLAFELWHRMSPDHVYVHTFSVVVYVNGRYHGLYTAADVPHGRMLAEAGLSNDSDLFKAVTHAANFSHLRPDGTAKQWLGEGLEKKEGTPAEGQPGAFDAMLDLIRFVDGASAATFRAERGARLNVRDHEDWWIFATLVLATDGMAKNAYHAYQPGSGKPWRYVPWDLDATFGQGFDTTRRAPDERRTYAERNRLFQRMLEDPALAGPLRERYRGLLAGALSTAAVLARFDALVAETAPSARRDWSKWGGAYRRFGAPGTPGADYFSGWYARRDFTSYEGEVAYVREWVRRRWATLGERVP